MKNFDLNLTNEDKKSLFNVLLIIGTILGVFSKNKEIKLLLIFFLIVGITQYIYILKKETKGPGYQFINAITCGSFSGILTTFFATNLIELLENTLSSSINILMTLILFLTYFLTLAIILYNAIK